MREMQWKLSGMRKGFDMLIFKKVDIEDIPVLSKFYSRYPSGSCDTTVGSIVMWRDYFDYRYAISDDTLTVLSEHDGDFCFSFPIGCCPEKMVGMIGEYCKANDIPMKICTLNAEETEIIAKMYPDYSSFADRNWFDYVYDFSALASLEGKNYSHQRNQIHKFEREYLDYSYEIITDDNINEVIDFNNSFTFHAEKQDDSADREVEMCLDVLKNYNYYDFAGGILRVDGKVVGYSIGEIIGDTIYIHIEKADTSYRGVYQMISNLFLKNNASDEIKYVNREEDCGDEGLRKSKLSCNPLFLLQKNFCSCI